VAYAVEHLPRKCEVLNLNPSTAKKNSVSRLCLDGNNSNFSLLICPSV
jgi:hypothetical protein